MEPTDCRSPIIAAATPLFARHGLNGVSIRELAKAAAVPTSLISYHFGGKAGLYEAVLRDVFAGMLEIARVAQQPIAPSEKFAQYVYQCGICFHTGGGEQFVPHTASADSDAPECPHCLNNDAESFSQQKKSIERAA